MRAAALALIVLLLAACGRDVGGDDATRGSRPEDPATEEVEESPPRSEPRVLIRTRLRPYDISGSSGVDLRAAMERLGPKDPVSGTPYDGYTKWTISWSYGYERANACALADVRVVARIRITLPRWGGIGRADPSLAAEWSRFIAALRRHENEHAGIASNAARRVARRLAALGPSRSCARLERKADAAAGQILKEVRAAEIAYDKRTGHGDTQGARFSG